MNVKINLQNRWLIPENVVAQNPVIMPEQLETQLRQVFEDDIVDLYLEWWVSIRSYNREATNIGRSSLYNFRLPLMDCETALRAFIHSVHYRQAIGYKVNTSCGFILQNKISGRLRYFHLSMNDLSIFPNPRSVYYMDRLNELIKDHLKDMTLIGHPTSDWVTVTMTNIVLCLYYTNIPLIRGLGGHGEDNSHDDDEDVRFFMFRSVHLIPLKTDNLCLFWCLALVREPHLSGAGLTSTAKDLIQKWKDQTRSGVDPKNFEGVSMDQSPSIDRCFGVGLWLYTTGRLNGCVHARLLRSPAPGEHAKVNKVSLHLTANQRHVHLIKDINSYAQAFLCSRCDKPFKTEYYKRCHEITCLRSCQFH